MFVYKKLAREIFKIRSDVLSVSLPAVASLSHWRIYIMNTSFPAHRSFTICSIIWLETLFTVGDKVHFTPVKSGPLSSLKFTISLETLLYYKLVISSTYLTRDTKQWCKLALALIQAVLWLICNHRQICGKANSTQVMLAIGLVFRVWCGIYKCPGFLLVTQFVARALGYCAKWSLVIFHSLLMQHAILGNVSVP